MGNFCGLEGFGKSRKRRRWSKRPGWICEGPWRSIAAVAVHAPVLYRVHLPISTGRVGTVTPLLSNAIRVAQRLWPALPKGAASLGLQAEENANDAALVVVRWARGLQASVADEHHDAGSRPRFWCRTNRERRSMAGDIAAVGLSSITSPRWTALVHHLQTLRLTLAASAPSRKHPKQHHLMPHSAPQEGIHHANHPHH